MLAGPLTAVAPSSWLRLPRRTARMRLTLLYSGLFMLLGTCVIVVILLLGTGGVSRRAAAAAPLSQSAVPGPGGPAGPDVLVTQQHENDAARLLAVSWFALALTALASAPLGWIAAGRVLRPLRAITSTAQTISAGTLHERLALSGPDDEFKQLGDTLDELLGRLEASFEAQRRFVANASHELRTPLTLQRTLLQVALANPNATAQSLRSTCEELLSAGTEHERLLESLLTLASSERGLDRREPLDLSILAAHALARVAPEIERQSLRVDAALYPARLAGDPALLECLLANLVENAVTYNVASGEVAVRTGVDREDVVLRVSNTGRPIAAEEVERLFEPFHRLGASRTGEDGHHGLGLSIVGAIATAHRAELVATAPPRGGLNVTLRFPRDAAPA